MLSVSMKTKTLNGLAAGENLKISVKKLKIKNEDGVAQSNSLNLRRSNMSSC